MPASVFPAPSTSTSSVNARVFATAASYTTYEINESFESGGYTVTTSPSNSQVSLIFSNSTSILVNTQTTSGTVSFSLPSEATTLSLADISGNAITTVTVTYTSVNATGSSISGTLDTITTTSTYNQTGLLYPLLVGGGGSGGDGAGGAFVRLDLDDFEGAMAIVKRAIEEDWWSARIDIIRKEKHKILEEIGFFPRLKKVLGV